MPAWISPRALGTRHRMAASARTSSPAAARKRRRLSTTSTPVAQALAEIPNPAATSRSGCSSDGYLKLISSPWSAMAGRVKAAARRPPPTSPGPPEP